MQPAGELPGKVNCIYAFVDVEAKTGFAGAQL